MIRRFHLILCFALFASLGAEYVAAQPPGIDTVDIPGYHYDSRFLFGVNIVSGKAGLLPLIWNALQPDYTYSYGGTKQAEMNTLRNPMLWDTSTAWNKFVLFGRLDYWLNRETYPIKAIFAPGAFRTIGSDAMSTENFYQTLAGDTLERKWVSYMGAVYDDTVFFETQMLNAGRFLPCENPPCDVEIAGFPNHTFQAMVRDGDDLNSLYARTGTSGPVDAFDVSFVMRADRTALEDIDSDTVIAYAILYRRDTTAQTGPGAQLCSLYTPFDSVAITKGLYLNEGNPNVHLRSDPDKIGDDFREFYFPVLFPDSARSLPRDSATVGGFTFRWGGDLWHPFVPSAKSFVWGGGGDVPFCALLDSVLVAEGVLDARTVNFPNAGPEGSDFVWVFHTTGYVRIDFLSGRFSRHTYQLLQRGDFDSLLAADLDNVLDDPLLDTTVFRIAMTDEVYAPRIPAAGMAMARAARYLLEREPENTRGTWINPQRDNALARISFGDLDSTGYKPMQLMASQAYEFGGAIPVYYANPDTTQMAWEASRDYYKMGIKDHIETLESMGGQGDENENGVIGDTIHTRFIMGPSVPDYEHYLAESQKHLGGTVNKFAQQAAISRTWFRRFSQAVPYPVTAVVQVHGYAEQDDNGYTGYFRNAWRPTTPEEITAQCWLALNAGIDGGIMFSDFGWDGGEFGVMNARTLDTATGYGVLSQYPDPNHTGPGWTLPKMWLGFNSRYPAVKNIVAEFREKILPVYTALDLYNGKNVCVHALPDWTTVPMLSAVRGERVQTDLGYNLPINVFDAPDSTYLETAVFSPTERDSAGYAEDARYMIITNRRLWPVTSKPYSPHVIALLDSLAVFDTDTTTDYRTSDFGRIDIRRPLVVLKNSTQTMADSVLIEKVGYEGTWSERHAFGDSISLDYLNPGAGAMYRLVPIPRGVSTEGVAFNNAVRSENPSTDAETKPIVAVVERDSAIWLRTYTPGLGWGSETMISAAADTLRATTVPRRRAHNTFPAIATTRGDSATLIVWQRVDTSSRGTVESLWIPGPPTAANLAGAVAFRLSAPRVLSQSWMLMTPSVVGIDGGWVVAYGAPKDGIEVVALRNASPPVTSTDLSATTKVRATKIQFPSRRPGFQAGTVTLDSTAMFPTMAYVSDTVPILFEVGDGVGRPVHLAWQQSGHDTGATATGPYIFYRRVDVEWNTSGKPAIHAEKGIEHVTHGLPGCSFEHPSIAADSTRIGITFESHMQIMPKSAPGGAPLDNIDVITLRFRDSIKNGSTAGAAPWSVPAYYWGDSSTAYGYPSLTEFPAVAKSSLGFLPQGGLVWFDQDDMKTQKFYRYGSRFASDLPGGSFPTMTLSPYLKSTPMTKTGTLYRGDAGTSFDQPKGWGDTGVYYPSKLLSNETRGAFDFGDVFTALPQTSGISSGFSLGSWVPYSGGASCDFVLVHGAILFDSPPDHEGGGIHEPPLGKGFFGATEHGDSWVETPTEIADVVSSTGLFTAGTDPVTINRFIARTSNTTTWLNTFPVDTILNSLPDVKIMTELVRASDGYVLWRDDTLSVRSMSTDEEADLVSVPVDTYATPGTSVYIRLRPVPTMDMEYSLTGGYQFYDGSAAGGFAKLTGPRFEEEQGSGNLSATTQGLSVRVIPNPARDRAEVRVRVTSAGRVRLSIYNTLGEKLADLPTLEASGAGEYMVAVSVSGVPPGAYLLRAESGGAETTARFSVVR